jgi:hypothetical protein
MVIQRLLRRKVRTKPQIVQHAGGYRDSGVQRQSSQIDVNASHDGASRTRY